MFKDVEYSFTYKPKYLLKNSNSLTVVPVTLCFAHVASAIPYYIPLPNSIVHCGSLDCPSAVIVLTLMR